MSKLLLTVVCSATIFGNVFAQVTKQVAPPSYPPAARAVRATGKVGVTVRVDPSGQVVSAEAFSGNPLLRASSVAAAKDWLFESIVPDTIERNFLLFFNYTDKLENKLIEESEVEWSSIIHFEPITQFELDLSAEIQIPKLLKLPRKAGKLQDEFCPIHKEKLLTEIQSVDCSGSNELYEADRKFWDNDDYEDAESTQFPEANIFAGCKDNGVERVEIRYCEKCRQARKDWIARNGG